MSGWRSYHISSATDSGQSYGIPAGEGHDIVIPGGAQEIIKCHSERSPRNYKIVILSEAPKKIINCHSERSEESAGEDNNNND